MSVPLQPSSDLHSVLHEVLIGSHRDIQRRRDMLSYDAPNEIDQQIQVAISGTAGIGAAYVPFQVGFDVFFISGSLQRPSNLRWPHFTYGYVIDPPALVQVWCHVTQWVLDQDLNQGPVTYSPFQPALPLSNNAIIGAQMVWGSSAPEQQPGDLVTFTGALHLNFQGLAAPPEFDDEATQDTTQPPLSAPVNVTLPTIQ